MSMENAEQLVEKIKLTRPRLIYPKIPCPHCEHRMSQVLETRAMNRGNPSVYRRRKCLKCLRRFSTWERSCSADLRKILMLVCELQNEVKRQMHGEEDS